MATPTSLPATFVAGNVLTAAQMNDLRGAFRVLQVVRATDTSDRTTSTATFADANISVTITPTDTSSTLLIVWTNHLISNLSSQLSAHLQITDSSNVALSGAEDARIGNGGGSVASFSYNTIIGYAAPATTSAVTYKGRWKLNTATFSATLANATTTGQMFALEISA